MTTLDVRTLARRTHPAESFEAAAKPRKVDEIRRGILAILSDGKERTLDQICTAYHRRAAQGEFPMAAASSIRTRATELRRDGRVDKVPGRRGKSNMGNNAALWRILPVQQELPGGAE